MSSQLMRPSEAQHERAVATKPGAPPSHWRFVVLFLILFVLFFLRRPDSLMNPQFWAEDGALLFQGQLLHGSVAWIFQPYRGYLILDTKLLAAFAALFPVLYAPLIYDTLAILISSLACSLFALPWYRYLVRSDSLRIAVCLGITGAIYTQSLVDNASNTQWYVALIGLLLLFRGSVTREKPWRTIAFAVVACTAALTNPVMVIAAPICVLQLATKRNRWVAATLLAGIVVEIGVFLAYPAVATPAPPKPHAVTLATAVVVSAVYKVVISSFLGWRAALDVSNAGSSVLFFLILVGAAAWLMWLFLRAESAKRIQILLALYVAGASIVLPLSGRGLFQAFRTVTHIKEPRGEQYFFIAGCVLLFLLALTMERFVPPRWKYLQAGLFVLAMAGGFYENFRVPPFYDFHWPEEARAIEHWSEARDASFALGVTVPLNPPTWSILLPPSFHELTIAGFPDHVWARPTEGNGKPIRIDASFIRDTRDLEYIDLPLELGSDTLYRVRAVLQSKGNAIVSLLIHGRLDHGAWVETPPIQVVNDMQIGTEIRTDATGRLCIHLVRLSGAHASFRSIVLSHR